MNTHTASFVARGRLLPACALGLATFFGHSPHAWAQQRCQVTGVDVQKSQGGRDVRIHTSCTPNYTVFRLSNPMRVVVDVAGGDVSAISGPMTVEDGIIGHVAVRQYHSDAAPIGRVIVSFDAESGYDVRGEGQDIVLHAQKLRSTDLDAHVEEPEPHAVAAPPAAAPLRPAIMLPALQVTQSLAPAAALKSAGVAESAPKIRPEAGANHAQQARLHRIEHHDAGVLLRLSSTPTYTTTRLTNPPRLVVDLSNTKPRVANLRGPKSTKWAHRVRMAQHSGGLRVVFDLRADTDATVEPGKKGLWVRPRKPLIAKLSTTSNATPPGQASSLTTAALKEVTFDSAMQGDRVVSRLFLRTDTDAKPVVDVSNEHAWVLELANTTLPEALERAIDTSADPGAVTLVSTFAAQRKPPKVHVVVNLAQAASQVLSQVPHGWMWQIQSAPQAVKSQALAPKVAAFVADAVAPVEQPSQPAAAIGSISGPAAGALSPNRGSTKRISIDVKDADIINVLRLISEETGDNIIASDEVHGKVSLKLRNVPADEALDTMLRTKGFDRVRHNNILRVASAESIQKEREQDLARRKALAEVEDTFIKMVTINYATATEVVDQLKPLLSPRGSVQVDNRTNTLIMQDVASNIDRLVELARRLDKQTPLVNIQARIVEAQSSYLRDLGVQWGGATQNTARTGNPTGVYFPGDVMVSGAADAGTTNQANGVTTPSRYAVNLPAALAGQGGGLGFILGSAGGSHMLDLRLTAMETNGTGKVISSPEVSTLDNKTARVSQGVEIPVSVVSAAGTNVRFVPAVLELEVTPHVTNDGTVLLRIKVQKSQLDYTQKSAAGDPSIQKKQAETEVLVRDGDTSVIGGIYTRTTSDTYSEVPFLARIPLFGRLFREHRGEDNRSELLVFITPRIINRDESVVQTGSILQGTKTAR